MRTYLEFEKPIAEIEAKIQTLQDERGKQGANEKALGLETLRLEERVTHMLQKVYRGLTPWQKVQVARHPQRPHFTHYCGALIDDFMPLAGDRSFAEDEAIVAGIGRFRGQSVCVMGHEKGSNTETRVRHNFGMARPEGYRKAVRLMELADRFNIPLITFIDTAGAYPGIDAEERGQAEAIARSTEACLDFGQPSISIIIGEGGSGGAIALAATNIVLMLENAVYSVISPEGAASILWRDAARAQEAASTMKMTAQDLLQFRIIDSIIPEPLGGAHRNLDEAITRVGDGIEAALKPLLGRSSQELRKHRAEKFLRLGHI
jgi:acetyl-CoA carboxylase carboxyl transferase subunit alpha